MKNRRAIYEFFAEPSMILTSYVWALGLSLLSGAVAAAALGAFNIHVRAFMFIISTALVIYALYGTAHYYGLPQRFVAFLRRSPNISRFLDSYNVRTAIFACGSIVIDVSYAVIELAVGYSMNSRWFIVNGTYYLLLSLMRVFVIWFGARPLAKGGLTEDERTKHGIRVFRTTGIALLILNSTLTALFEIILVSGENFTRHYFLIYATGIYTVIRVAFAVRGFIKTRKSDNLVTRSLRAISIVTALVALLSFQTSFITTFPGAENYVMHGTIMSGYISLFTFILGVRMIMKARKYKKELKRKIKNA